MTDNEVKICSDFQAMFSVEPRKEQLEALSLIEEALKAHNVVLLNAPTGCGKSLIAVKALIDEGGGFLVASNRALQDQYENDPMLKNLVCVLKGKVNYPCPYRIDFYHKTHEGKYSDPEEIAKLTCASANFERDCVSCKKTVSYTCPYLEAKNDARNSVLSGNVAVINPAIVRYLEYIFPELSGRNLIVFDEAHSLESMYRLFETKNILSKKIFKILKEYNAVQTDDPVDFLEDSVPTFYAYLFNEKYNGLIKNRSITDINIIMPLLESLITVCNKAVDVGSYSAAGSDKFSDDKLELQCLISYIEGLHKKFSNYDIKAVYSNFDYSKKINKLECSPVDVRHIHESSFIYGNKQLLMSATIVNDYHDKVLGLDKCEKTYLEVGSSFSPEQFKTIIFCQESGEYTNIENHKRYFAEIIDKLLSKGKGIRDTRGIIHTINKDNLEYLKVVLSDKSYFSRLLFVEDLSNYSEIMKKHSSRTDSVIVSASLTEGIDLKGDLGEFCIVLKVPVPFFDNVIKNKQTLNHRAMDIESGISLSQQVGRVIRTDKDIANIVIIDSRIATMAGVTKYRKYLSRPFNKAILARSLVGNK